MTEFQALQCTVIRYRALTFVVHLTLRTANDGWDKGRELCGMYTVQ